MTKSNITRATAVAVAVGVLAGSAAYDTHAKSESDEAKPVRVVALASPSSADDVVVVVNGHEVTRGEVDRRVDSMLGGQVAKLAPEQLDGIRAQLATRVTDGVIVQTLLEQAVEKEGIEVSAADVDGAMKQIEGSLPPGKTMADYLAATGTSEGELREQLGLTLGIDRFIAAKTRDATPGKEEVATFYEENDEMFQAPERAEVRHILVALPPEADDALKAEKRKEAEEIRASLVSGETERFAEVAAERSDCPSKVGGGELGLIARGETVPEFEKAIFSQDVGVVGPVVETPFGFHVVQVERREPAGKVSLADATPFIEQRLTEEHQQAAMAKLIEDLRANAEVVYPGKEAA